MIYVICTGQGKLLANLTFGDPDRAKEWFEAKLASDMSKMAAPEEIPTLEWREVETPEWAYGETWIGLVGGTPDDPEAQPHVAALELFE